MTNLYLFYQICLIKLVIMSKMMYYKSIRSNINRNKIVWNIPQETSLNNIIIEVIHRVSTTLLKKDFFDSDGLGSCNIIENGLW